MISIYDKLWFILQGDKNSEGTLAYMGVGYLYLTLIGFSITEEFKNKGGSL